MSETGHLTGVNPAQNLYQQAHAAYQRKDNLAGKRLLAASFLVSRSLPGPWFHLGTVFSELDKRPHAAIAANRRAVELLPNDAFLLTNLGWSLYQVGRYEEALAWIDRAISVSPNSYLQWTDKALIEIALRDSGVASAARALALAPGDIQAQMAYAFACSFAGRVYEGLLAYESRIPGKMPEFMAYPLPRWDGAPVNHLFIAAEQGLGDTLMFGRFFKRASRLVDKITLCVQPELVRLFSVYFDKLDIKNVTILRMPGGIPTDADAYCPIMSLPTTMADAEAKEDYEDTKKSECGAFVWTDNDKDGYILGFEAAYLRDVVSDLAEEPIGIRKQIGIVWAGSPEQDVDDQRSTTPETFLQLYDAPGIELISLQFGKRKYDLEPYGPLIYDGTDGIRDMYDTAKVIAKLDAVVTVCTSVAHLALALGVPTYIILPRHGQHWVWGYGDKSIWYPDALLFRQEVMGRWDEPMGQVVAALPAVRGSE